MSDQDKASKTEKATPKKIQKAFERGQFANSPEIYTLFILFTGYSIMKLAGGGQATILSNFSGTIFANLGKIPVTQATAIEWFGRGFPTIIGIIFPLLGACVIAGAVAGGLQSGFKLTPKAMEPKWEKLDPIKGLKRIYSMNTLVQFGVDLLKFVAIGWIVYALVRTKLEDPIFWAPVPAKYIGQFIFETSLTMIGRLIVAIIAIAGIHYAWQRYKTAQDMMMTKQEIKDEMKQQEGDPMTKLRQRQMGFLLRQKQMLAEVPTADVVVTNPTHFAVAMKYEAGLDTAPVILAKGKNRFAFRIRDLAKKHGVPIIENPPAARALYTLADVGKPIPGPLYEIVAAILNYVYREHRYYFYRLKITRQERRTRVAKVELSQKLQKGIAS